MSESKRVIIHKPIIDDRVYDFMVLSNGLRVLTVSHPDSEVSAASLRVEAGNFQNPPDVLGLAHFLEHMIFMGTEKYPDEKDFSEFVSKNAGSTNAFTQNDSTTFYYEILSASFEESLDKFAQFFINPLLKEDGIQRELSSVNSEFEKNISVDEWRLQQIVKELAEPTKHPFVQFTTGNRATLDQPNIRDRVKEFFEKNYSSNLMHLVIYGTGTTEDLQNLAKKYFSDVKNLKLPRQYYEGTLYYPPTMYKKIHHVLSIREQRRLSLYFPTVFRFSEYKKSMLNLVGHLIGHEAKGTLYDLLKEKGWATTLLAGRWYKWNGLLVWGIQFGLSKEGESHIEEIIRDFYDFLAFVRKMSVEDLKRSFEEGKQLTNECAFQFRDNARPSEICPALSACMMSLEPEDFLHGLNYFYDFDENQFRKEVSDLNMENMMSFWSSKQIHQTDLEKDPSSFETEKIYGSRYKTVNFSPELVEYIQKTMDPTTFTPSEHFKVPEVNEFIPKNLSILGFPNTEEKERNKFPRLIYDTPKIKVYYKQDTQFDRPKSDIVIRLHLPCAIETVRNNLSQILFSSLCYDALNSVTYYAEVANLSFDVRGDKHGLLLRFSGWNDSLPKLSRMVVNSVTGFQCEFDPGRFLVIKDEVMRRYNNFKVTTPIYLAMYLSTFALSGTPDYHFEDFIEAGETITLKDVEEYYRKEMMSPESPSSVVRMDMLVIGNNSEEEIRGYFVKELLEGNQKLSKMDVYKEEDFKVKKRIVKLERGVSPYVITCKSMNPVDKNNCLVYNIQVGPRSDKLEIIHNLLGLIMGADVFDTLRTKQQLGYIVGIRFMISLDLVGFIQFYIQSSDYDPVELVKRVEAFIVEYYDTLKKKLTEEYFEEQMEALRQKYAEKRKRLAEEVADCWEEIFKKTLRFNRNMEYVKMIEEKVISRQDILKFYETHFLKKDKPVFMLQLFSQAVDDEKKEQPSSSTQKSMRVKNMEGLEGFSEDRYSEDIYHLKNTLEFYHEDNNNNNNNNNSQQ